MGYANQTTFELIATVENNQELYEAMKAYTRTCLERVPGMTDQTLGMNLRLRLYAWAAGFTVETGWGFDDVALPHHRFEKALEYYDRTKHGLVNEMELVQMAKTALELDEETP